MIVEITVSSGFRIVLLNNRERDEVLLAHNLYLAGINLQTRPILILSKLFYHFCVHRLDLRLSLLHILHI